MYTINYDLITGEVTGIQNGDMSIPIFEGNMDFRDFLAWNAKQAKPLDLKTPKEIPLPSLAERREEEYRKQGCTIEALIVALWEIVVENRPDAATALEEVRERVKEEVVA